MNQHYKVLHKLTIICHIPGIMLLQIKNKQEAQGPGYSA